MGVILLDFANNLKEFCTRLRNLTTRVKTEEATKTAMIMPFFSLLGYDVFNPLEFVPEYTADVGIKKGEKVDYAILDKKQNPIILIEAKCCGENLDKHGSQLFRYFSTTSAKFGILTNGVIYKFYTDLAEQNRMDTKPFLVVDLLNLKDSDIADLNQFQKDVFTISSVLAKAAELNYNDQIKQFFLRQLDDPDSDFVTYVLTDIYKGRKTQKVIEDFRPIVKKAFGQLINDKISERLQNVLDSEKSSGIEHIIIKQKIPKARELPEGYVIVKALIFESLNGREIDFTDSECLEIFLKDNPQNWICRIDLLNNRLYINMQSGEKNFVKRQIRAVQDIYFYKNLLCQATPLKTNLS